MRSRLWLSASSSGFSRRQRVDPRRVPRAVASGIEPRDLAEAGWGVVFADGVDPAIREALTPLLELRRSQASRIDERRYRELDHLERETKRRFLPRHGAGPGPVVDPSVVPYYLLLVGAPDRVPFDLQFGLEVQYAVGRLSFESAEDYARYARSVVAYEAGAPGRPPGVTLFGVENEDDPPTESEPRAPGAAARPAARRRRARPHPAGPGVRGDTGESRPVRRRGRRARPAFHRRACGSVPGRSPSATGRARGPGVPGVARTSSLARRPHAGRVPVLGPGCG